MGDNALKIMQMGLEGQYTPASGASVYNGGSPVRATRRLAIDKSANAEFKFMWDAPEESRGAYAGTYQHVLEGIQASGKIPTLLYFDDFCYYNRLAISGTPTVTTLPATPTTLLAATATAAAMSLTTQPNAASDGAAAKILAVTLSDASTSAVATTVTIAGTDIYGNALTETVNFTAGTQTPSAVFVGTPITSQTSVTLYTQNYFKTVTASGITVGTVTAGQQLAVGGVNGFLWVFKTDMQTGTLYSGTVEYFDGSASWQVPGVVAEKLSVDMQVGKSLKADLTFIGQKKVQLPSDPTSRVPAANAGDIGALTNLSDTITQAAATYKSRFFADPIGTAPGTTEIPARLTELKVDIETGAKVGKAADGSPYATFVGRAHYKISGEFTMLFNTASGSSFDPSEISQFLNQSSRTTRMVLPGVPMPCGQVTGTGSGWPSALQQSTFGGYYGMMFDIAGKYTEVTEKEVDNRAAFSYKFESEVDLINMGVPMQVTVVSRINPNQK